MKNRLIVHHHLPWLAKHMQVPLWKDAGGGSTALEGGLYIFF